MGAQRNQPDGVRRRRRGGPVDLREAAKELTPTFSDAFGEGGISMIGTQKRYGEWKEPA